MLAVTAPNNTLLIFHAHDVCVLMSRFELHFLALRTRVNLWCSFEKKHQGFSFELIVIKTKQVIACQYDLTLEGTTSRILSLTCPVQLCRD